MAARKKAAAKAAVAAEDPNPIKADSNPVEHGVPVLDQFLNERPEEDSPSKAAKDPNPIKGGMPTDPPPPDFNQPDDNKLKAKAALADEFNRLRAVGNPRDDARLAELKILLAKD